MSYCTGMMRPVELGRPWSFDGNGAAFRLVSEAHRIRLVHLFDPVLAVHTSMVEPLPLWSAKTPPEAFPIKVTLLH